MDLHLQAANPAGGGVIATTGKQDEAATSSEFSRLLARHVGRSSEMETAGDQLRVKDRNDAADEPVGRQRATETRENRPETRPPDGSGETRGNLGSKDASPGSEVEVVPGLTEYSLSLASLSGFLSMADPLGNLNFADPAFTGLEAVPGDVRARLAADIAGGFTDRRGVQTLTLNLEPEHLGKVDVRMRAEGDRLSVRILAATREAESALRENVKDLADTIRDKTGKYQQVDVRIELKSGAERDAAPSGRDKADDDSRRGAGDHRPDDSKQQDGHGGQEFTEEETASRPGMQEG